MKAYPEYKASGIDWIGNIPSHWQTIKGAWCCTFQYGFPADSRFFSNERKGIPLIRIRDIYSHDTEVYYNNSDFTTEYIVNNGDILIGMDGDFNVSYWKGGISLLNQRVCKFEKSDSLIKGFLFYVLPIILKEINNIKYSTTVKHLSAQDLSEMRLPIPPMAEQEAIATYLDDVTGKIDALISEKQKQVEDIRAYRTSLITETVTRGLNPDTPLRPSGIDWLGDIPQHWETSKLKYIGEARNGLTYSPDDICEQGKGVLVLRSSNIQNEQLCLEDNVYVSKEVDELMMKEGDILICSRNGSASLVGKCAIIPKGVNASFGAFMMRYRSIINKRFTLYLVRTTLAQHKAQFATSTINQLTNAMIGNMQVAVPPLAEQQAIADLLDAKTAKIDELIGELTKQIDELAEYKQSVITEAVTGKVDVRDYKPSN